MLALLATCSTKPEAECLRLRRTSLGLETAGEVAGNSRPCYECGDNQRCQRLNERLERVPLHSNMDFKAVTVAMELAIQGRAVLSRQITCRLEEHAHA